MENKMTLGLSGTEDIYKNVSVNALLKVASKYDIGVIELWLPENTWRDGLEKTKEILKNSKIQVGAVSTWTQLNLPRDIESSQDLILKSIELATSLGANIVNTYFGPNESRDEVTAIRCYAKNLKPCLEKAEDLGIIITLENEFGPSESDITRTAQGVLHLIQGVGSDSFKLNFDPCNFYIAGEEPYPFAYNLLKDYIAYVHVKDATKYEASTTDQEANQKIWEDVSGQYQCVSVGQGAINWEGLLTSLSNDGYEVFLTLEPHTPKEQLMATYGASLNYLRSKGLR